MDKDCNLPPDEADTKDMSLDDRDLVVGNVYRKCVASLGNIMHQNPWVPAYHKAQPHVVS